MSQGFPDVKEISQVLGQLELWQDTRVVKATITVTKKAVTVAISNATDQTWFGGAIGKVKWSVD